MLEPYRRWGILLAALLAACDGGGTSLVVDLRTDLVPGLQFTGVTVEVLRGDTDEVLAMERDFAAFGEDYLSGVRLAEVDGLPVGPAAVRVTLYDRFNEPVIGRTTLIRLTADHAVTVLITDNCRGVSCPAAGDDPALTACVGGRCVDPQCSPETPEHCGDPGCATDAQCVAAVACAEPTCILGECFVAADDSRCDEGTVCDPQLGCVLRPDVDAGPACPATETECTDGVDDDCDDLVDCADPDCLGQSCDDESVCTETDVCRDDGTCGGDAIVCDDGEVCTDDGCDPVSGCTFTPNTADCDDGAWCNGPDTCRDGLCQDHGAPPCTDFCNEATMVCEECRADADCGSVTRGSWGGCGGYSDACDQSGTQSRSVMTPRCQSGMCTVSTTSESRSCSRSVADGTRCGGTWRRCCGGVCRDLTSNRYCGGCGVNCNAIGLSCQGTGTGGYSCRGCSTNAACRSILNGNATCYDVASPPAWCQCQCTSAGVCSNGGCGANMYCHACPGTNFCAPFGGSC